MAGRRSKYTEETVKRLTEAIRLGATYRLACNYAQIGERTFYEWLERYPQFSQAVKEAEGAGAIKLLAVIERAANGVFDKTGNMIQAPVWQAAAWKLERRYPREYGRNVTELTGGEKPLGIVWSDPVKPDDEVGLGADQLPQAGG